MTGEQRPQGGREMKQRVAIECQKCSGTGLYVGLAERDGTAVVCFRCKGTGKDHIEFVPFVSRLEPKEPVTQVHVSRGYVLSPNHADCDGGIPYSQWKPGMTIPADERLYCPMLYTNQSYCAFRTETGSARPGIGQRISDCEMWGVKEACWVKFHADNVPGQVS